MIRWSLAAHKTVPPKQLTTRSTSLSSVAQVLLCLFTALLLQLRLDFCLQKNKNQGDNLRKLFSENVVESYYVSRMCFHICWAFLIPGNSIGWSVLGIQQTHRLLTGFPSFKQLGKAGLKLLDIMKWCSLWYAAKSNVNVKMHHWPKKPLQKPYLWHIFSSWHGISLILRSWNASGASCGWAVQTVAGGTVLRCNGKVATVLE